MENFQVNLGGSKSYFTGYFQTSTLQRSKQHFLKRKLNGPHKSFSHVSIIINSNTLEGASLFLRKRQTGNNLKHLSYSSHYLKYPFLALFWTSKILLLP